LGIRFSADTFKFAIQPVYLGLAISKDRTAESESCRLDESNMFCFRSSPFKGSIMNAEPVDPIFDLAQKTAGKKFHTVLADPPWRFVNRTGKVAPEHRRLARYGTMTTEDICALPIAELTRQPAHLYLWVPNALLPDGLRVMEAWGFQYKSNIVWHKVRKDGGSDGRGVGFYFRNVTEILLFGVRGKNARTEAPGRSQVNYMSSRKREHSRKPDEQYRLIEDCSKGPYLELFARGTRPGWTYWGNQADESYRPTWATYAYNSTAEAAE
jgi:N6-adenosine-specific RNA methylase IME4